MIKKSIIWLLCIALLMPMATFATEENLPV